jgi:aubergine-like protein
MCQLTGLDEQTRKDFKAMRDLAVHTRKSPMQRAAELRKFISYMHGKTKTSGIKGEKSVKFMDSWNLKIGDSDDPQLFDIKGRELKPEPLIMNDPHKRTPVEIPGSREGDWDRTVKEWHMLDSKHLKYWVFVCTERDKGLASKFFNHLKDQGQRIGFQIENPEVMTADADRKDHFISAIKQVIFSIISKYSSI